jgi:hypothetical protein
MPAYERPPVVVIAAEAAATANIHKINFRMAVLLVGQQPPAFGRVRVAE